MSKLEEKVHEFAELAKSLPENLQVVCFELLLRNHLEGGQRPSGLLRPPVPDGAAILPSGGETAAPPTGGAAAKQEDLKSADLHLKAKKFLEKYGLSLAHFNNLFFKEGDELNPLYEDLKTTKISESQIRVTLLLALRNAIRNGEFEANTAAVRDECAQRKCYDSANFNANYNDRKTLFDFDKFSKDTTSVRLSEAGKKALADLVQELQ